LNRPTGKAKPSGDIYLFTTLNNLFVYKNVKKLFRAEKTSGRFFLACCPPAENNNETFDFHWTLRVMFSSAK